MDEKKIMKKLFYGSRDHARIPMQWSDQENAGFSKNKPWINVNPNYKDINVETEEKDYDSVLNFTRKMIRLRKENKALVYGSFEQIRTSSNIFAYYRKLDDQKFMIIMNLTDKDQLYPFKIDNTLISSNYRKYSNRLRPYEANIFIAD